MKPIIKMTAIAASLSIFTLSGCGNKNDDNSKSKAFSFNSAVLRDKVIKQMNNNSKVECSVAITEGEQTCDLSILAIDNSDVLKLKLSFNNKNKKAFNISEIKITEDSFIKQVIKDSLENANQELKNLINKEIKEFETNILSNIVIGQDDSYKPTFKFSNDKIAKDYIVSILENKIKPLLDNDDDKNDVENMIKKINQMGDINIDNIKKQLNEDAKNEFQASLDKFTAKQYQIYRDNKNLIISYVDETKKDTCIKTILQNDHPSDSRKVSFTINDRASFVDKSGKPCN